MAPRRRRLHDEQLVQTLAHAAAHAPYYRRTWGRAWQRVRSVRELPALPVLTKAEAIRNQRALVTTGRRAFVGVVSSGTHARDGQLLRVPRTGEEAQALGELEARAYGDAPADDGWGLEVRNVHHGVLGEAKPGRLVVPWTYTAQALRLLEDVLARPQADGRRVTSMVIGAGAVTAFTSWLLARDVDPARFGLSLIGTNGFRLAPRWKARVAAAFDATVLDNYSLSELPTPALECTDCGFNHWLLPPVVSEVVDPFTKAPVTKGVGVLVVTTLVPWVSAMPLVRYWTGDLVELGPHCDAVDGAGFRFRGRLEQSLATAKHGVLVAMQDVMDVVESSPSTARHPHPMETLGLVEGIECGAGKVELSLSTARGRVAPKVRVELRFDPRLFPEEAEAFGGELAKALLAASPALRKLERAKTGELEVALCAPGTLKKGWVKF